MASTAFVELAESTRAALSCYSNVHRGSGHYSNASTRLLEEARSITADYMGCGVGRSVIFGTPYSISRLTSELNLSDYHFLNFKINKNRIRKNKNGNGNNGNAAPSHGV